MCSWNVYFIYFPFYITPPPTLDSILLSCFECAKHFPGSRVKVCKTEYSENSCLNPHTHILWLFPWTQSSIGNHFWMSYGLFFWYSFDKNNHVCVCVCVFISCFFLTQKIYSIDFWTLNLSLNSMSWRSLHWYIKSPRSLCMVAEYSTQRSYLDLFSQSSE